MIKVVLWDVDGTLLNFREVEKYALRKCFSIFDLGECTDEMIGRYSKINAKYWERLERREITKIEVLHNRFAEFFETEGINFQKVDAFNNEYQLRLGDEIFFNDDSYKLMELLKEKQILQYAVTNGTDVAQKRKLERSGLNKIFDDVFISEHIGADKPNKAFFDAVWEKIGDYEKDEVMIVGDSLTSDMQGGVNEGIICCWYNPYHAANKMNLELTYEIQNLWQVEEIIEQLSRA